MYVSAHLQWVGYTFYKQTFCCFKYHNTLKSHHVQQEQDNNGGGKDVKSMAVLRLSLHQKLTCSSWSFHRLFQAHAAAAAGRLSQGFIQLKTLSS